MQGGYTMCKKFMLCIIVAALAFLTTGLQAQEITGDVAFIRGGYEWNTIKTTQYSDPLLFVYGPYYYLYKPATVSEGKIKGFSVEGEYNVNLGGMFLGFSVEYARLEDKIDSEKLVYHFLSPMVSLKIIVPGGFYIGPGVSARYLMDSNVSGLDSEVDIWANGIAGFMTPIAEAVYIDIQGRFGWNITKKQFDAKDLNIDKNYDMAFYVGFGTRTRSTGI